MSPPYEPPAGYVVESLYLSDPAMSPDFASSFDGLAIRLFLFIVAAVAMGGAIYAFASFLVPERGQDPKSAGAPRPLGPIPSSGKTVPAIAALERSSRRAIDLTSVANRVADFSLAECEELIVESFRTAQHARARGQMGELKLAISELAVEGLLEGGRDVGVVHEVRIAKLQLIRAASSLEISQLVYRISALTDETTRSGTRSWWDVSYEWAVARLPHAAAWRITRVTLEARAPLFPPHWDADKPSGRIEPIRPDPDLPSQLETVDRPDRPFDAERFREGATACFHAVMTAWTNQDPALADRWLGRAAREQFATLLFRYERANMRRVRSDATLGTLEPVRAHHDQGGDWISLHISGQVRDLVVDNDGSVPGEQVDRALPFSEYWTFLRPPGRTWRLVRRETPEEWVL